MELKRVFLLSVLLISMNLVSAINLEIQKTPLSDVIITELDNQAVFNFTIKNLGETDSFEIYSLVGVDITPKGTFSIQAGETKQITVKVKTGDSIKRNPGYVTFVYKIKGSNTGIQEDMLTIKIVHLKDALELSADNINKENDKATFYLQNKENFNFESIQSKFSSVFFTFAENFSLAGLEKKTFTVSLDKDKMQSLMAGPYILAADVKTGNAEEDLETTFQFMERAGVSQSAVKEGFIIVREEIEKKNEGNTPVVAEIKISRNIFSRLLTTFSSTPDKAERNGYIVDYIWQKELRPGDSIKVVARTNWGIPIGILLAIIIAAIIFKVYFTSDLILNKKINFVKTKGGEFALKVSVNARAKKFVERVTLIDKLPQIVKLYERYGTIAPDKIDEKNRRLEWNIESLNQGEERTVSYIIYSKIGVVGKFELPPAKAIYEKDGKIRETASNMVFFINEPKKIETESFLEL